MRRRRPAVGRRSVIHVVAAIAALLGIDAGAADEPVLEALVASAVTSSPESSSPVINLQAIRRDPRSLPIGVFDSGIGGLTVLDAILRLDAFHNDSYALGADGTPDFQGERFVYLGDQANMPYGNYTAHGRELFSRELIIKDAIFLLGRPTAPEATIRPPRFEKPPTKAIVIACNTASAYGMDDLRAAIDRWQVPVIVVGVVEAGARSIVENLPRDGQPNSVAVLATVGTCGSLAYPKAIQRAAGLAGRRIPSVVQQGSVGLAGAIEGDPSLLASDAEEAFARLPGGRRTPYAGPSVDNPQARVVPALADRYGFDEAGLLGSIDDPASWRLNSIDNYVRYDLVTLLETCRRDGATRPIDTLVLGCTHFPFAQPSMERELARLRAWRDADGRAPYAELIAQRLAFVDPAQETARELFRRLAQARLLRHDDDLQATQLDRFYLTVPNPDAPGVELTADGTFTAAYKYGRTAGRSDVPDIKYVPLTWSLMSPPVARLIRDRLTAVARRLDVQ